MLLAYYGGLHYLDLLSSFRDIAYAVQYGSDLRTAQLDPTFGCLSNFRAKCHENGIFLVSPYTNRDLNIDFSKGGPFIFLVSGTSGSMPLTGILDQVSVGSNMAVLYSEQIRSLYQDAYQELLCELNISQDDLVASAKSYEEKPFGQGRVLFVDADEISDAFMEGGPFCQYPAEVQTRSLRRMEDVISKISLFQVPCVDCVVRSVPSTWPKDERLTIEVELNNRSVLDLHSVVVDISLPKEFEPVSINTIEIELFRSLSTRSVTTLAIPRKKGVFYNPISITVSHQDRMYSVFLPNSKIQILENVDMLLRNSRPSTVNIFEALPKYERYLRPIVSSDVVFELLRVDPDSVVAKTRRVGENIIKQIASKHIKSFNKSSSFYDANRQLYELGIIGAKAKGYIETIRVFGNMASHADINDNDAFDADDAMVVLHALLLFLDEVAEHQLL